MSEERKMRRSVEKSSGRYVKNVMTVIGIVGVLVCFGCAAICYWAMTEIHEKNKAYLVELDASIDKKIEDFKILVDSLEKRLNTKIAEIRSHIEDNKTTTKNTLERIQKNMDDNQRRLVDLTNENQRKFTTLANDNFSALNKKIVEMKKELSALIQRLIDLYS